MEDEDLTRTIIGCAMVVHRALGPGLLESVYEKVWAHELRKAALAVACESKITVRYDDIVVGDFAADMVVDERVLENKATRTLAVAHEVQLVNYLTATGMDVGLLLNFGAARLQFKRISKDGAAVQRDWANHRNVLQNSASDWTPVIDAALGCIRDECGCRNWDGDDGEPVSRRTIALARKIVEATFASLPLNTPPPDLVAEPDGEISVSWVRDAKRMFAVSIGEHGKLNFADQFGDKGAQHGWTPVDGADEASVESSVTEMVQKIGLLYAEADARRSA